MASIILPCSLCANFRKRDGPETKGHNSKNSHRALPVGVLCVTLFASDDHPEPIS